MAMTVEMILKLVDQLTGPLNKALDQVKKLQQAADQAKPGSAGVAAWEAQERAIQKSIAAADKLRTTASMSMPMGNATAAWTAQATAIQKAAAAADKLRMSTRMSQPMPSGVSAWTAQATAIRKAADEAERLDRAAGRAANRWANLGGALYAMQRMSQVGASIAKPFDAAIDSAASFEDKVTDIAVAAEALDKKQDIGERIMRVSRGTNLPWQDVAQGQRDILGLGGTAMLGKIAPIEENVGRLVFASRAEAPDIYKMLNTYVGVVGMSVEQALANLRLNYAQGKEGAFELKDMARFMPSLGSMGMQYGLSRQEIGRDIPALLQVVRKTVGEPNEAATRVQHGLQKLQDPSTAKKIQKELGVDIYKVRKQAIAQGKNPFFAVLDAITDKLETSDPGVKVNAADGRIDGGDPKKAGSIARDFYFRAMLAAYAQNRRELGKFMIGDDAARTTAETDFEARRQTALAAKQRLETAKDEAKIAAGDTQVQHRKELTEKGVDALGKVRNWIKGNPGATSGAMLGGELIGHGLEIAGKVGAVVAPIMAWEGGRALLRNVFGVGKGLAMMPVDAARGVAQGVGIAVAEAQAAGGVAAATAATTAARTGLLSRMGAAALPGLMAEAMLRAGNIAAGNPLGETPARAEARRGLEASHLPMGSSRAQDDALKARMDEMRRQQAANQPQPVATMGAGPQVNTAQIDSAASRAAEAGQQIKASLDVTASPQVDASSIDAAIAKARELASTLASVGALIRSSAAAVGRGLKPSTAAMHDGTEAR